MKKLNLGCGNKLLPDYINIDLMVLPEEEYKGHNFIEADVQELPSLFAAESVDEVRAEHLFEHLTHAEITTLLFKIWSVLKPGGRLIIITPDFIKLLDELANRTSRGDFSTLDITCLKLFSTPDETLHRSIWYDEVGEWYLSREDLFTVDRITRPSKIEIQFEAIRK